MPTEVMDYSTLAELPTTVISILISKEMNLNFWSVRKQRQLSC
tara:strand:- start:1824 stop:1952 length:129 start_codon:yes stop_codon:yes gene_type:complete